jgi:surface antigen
VKKNLFVVSLFLLCVAGMQAGDNYCYNSQFYSPSNPYQCSICSNDANCTWWAWYQTQAQTSIWPESLPGFAGDAGQAWVTGAQNAHWGVTTTPTAGSIAVSTSIGHVAYVISTDGTGVNVSEMNCNYPSESYRNPYHWAYSTFQYYITPRPKINSIWPSPPTHSGSNQTIYTYGGAFEPNLTVLVTFPGGGQGTLSGSQIQYVSSTQINLQVTLNGTGTWSFVYKNPDGGWSSTFYFTVN